MLCVFKQSRSANAAAHAAGAARRPGGMASFGGAAAEKRKFKLVRFTFNCYFYFFYSCFDVALFVPAQGAATTAYMLSPFSVLFVILLLCSSLSFSSSSLRKLQVLRHSTLPLPRNLRYHFDYFRCCCNLQCLFADYCSFMFILWVLDPSAWIKTHFLHVHILFNWPLLRSHSHLFLFLL